MNAEQQLLYEEARAVLQVDPDALLLEIGTFMGGSAELFAHAIADAVRLHPTAKAKLVCVDPFYGHYDAGLQKVMADRQLGNSTFPFFCHHLGEHLQHVIPIAATREKVSALLQFFAPSGLKCRFAFIDGNHSSDSVAGDLAFVACLLAHPATILLHDAEWNEVGIPALDFCNAKGVPLVKLCGGSIAKIVL